MEMAAGFVFAGAGGGHDHIAHLWEYRVAKAQTGTHNFSGEVNSQFLPCDLLTAEVKTSSKTPVPNQYDSGPVINRLKISTAEVKRFLGGSVLDALQKL
jgi:hypothetical protein